MSYNSKYKGAEVEELLESIGNKVDKVDGKQLSTEDFTTLLKQKLEGLSNYDDTEIQESVSKLRSDLDTLVSGDTTTAIKTFNEVIAFLDGLEDTEDLVRIIASIEQQIAAKQDSLVSGTNIKTVNGMSLLGSGNIAISTAYPLSNHGTDSTTLEITPNTFHVWGTVTTLNLTLGAKTSDVANEYLFQFTSGTTQTTLTLPSTVVWANDDVPTIESGYTYVVSIMNELAIYAKF